jgi:hypothetical protein
MKKQLTAEQLTALQTYASEHGRNWKSALHDSWMTGNYDGSVDAGPLQQIRNTFGPTWLVRFNLKKAAADTQHPLSGNRPGNPILKAMDKLVEEAEIENPVFDDLKGAAKMLDQALSRLHPSLELYKDIKKVDEQLDCVRLSLEEGDYYSQRER